MARNSHPDLPRYRGLAPRVVLRGCVECGAREAAEFSHYCSAECRAESFDKGGVFAHNYGVIFLRARAGETAAKVNAPAQSKTEGARW